MVNLPYVLIALYTLNKIGHQKRVDSNDIDEKTIKGENRPTDSVLFTMPRSKLNIALLQSNKLVVIILSILLISALGVGVYLALQKDKRPEESQNSVLGALVNKVSFPIYYPDGSMLPEGYLFDETSVNSPQPEAILYNIIYDETKKLIFSLQPKLSDDEMEDFYANYIPLRNQIDTIVGSAEIGAYNNGPTLQTVVSLPIKDEKTWIIITAPYDIDQEDLKQVFNSLKK